MDGFTAFLQLIGALIGVLLVIFLAFWCTKLLSKKYSGKATGKHIKILDRTMITQDKMLILTKVNDKVYFLGVTDQSITMVDSTDAQNFPEVESEGEKLDFASVLKEKLLSQVPFRKQKGTEENKDHNNES